MKLLLSSSDESKYFDNEQSMEIAMWQTLSARGKKTAEAVDSDGCSIVKLRELMDSELGLNREQGTTVNLFLIKLTARPRRRVKYARVPHNS
jgi:hypothetical protein